MKLLPACGYKGGKRKFAPAIGALLMQEGEGGRGADEGYARYFDLCCGSGAVFLQLIEAGVPASNVTVAEAGPWGAYWKDISLGIFNADALDRLLHHDAPKDPRKVKAWVETEVATMPVSSLTFLVLQAAGFGSVPTWHDGTRWRHNEPDDNRGYHARGFWEPGPTSKETKPRGTIFDSKGIVERVRAHQEACRGITVHYGLVEELDCSGEGVYYLDPPYEGVNGYSHELDVPAFVTKGPRPLFVSERRPLEGAHEVIDLGARRSGNVRITRVESKRGAGKKTTEGEFVSIYRR